MAKNLGRQLINFDADIQKFIAGVGDDLPTPTPKLIKEMGARLRRLQTRYSLSTNPADKAVIKAEFDALAKAERDAKMAARKAKEVRAKRDASFVTGTNLFALTEMVLQHGPNDIPQRVATVDAPHLKRCVMAGLLEPRFGSMRLTQEGRARVADELVQRIGRKSAPPRENTFIKDPQARQQDLETQRAKAQSHLDKLERVLAALTR